MTRTLLILAAALHAGCLSSANGLTDTGVTPSDVTDTSTGTANHVRVATFNVQRFFDTTCDSGDCGGGAFEPTVTQDQFDAKARAITGAIEAMDAEFILLQEIESEACLDALQSRLGSPYPVAYIGEIDIPGSVDVAVLAEGTLLQVITHRQHAIPLPDGDTTVFSRELPEVHIERDGQRIILLPLHFRSKYNDDPARRLAEANAARDIVAEVSANHPEALIILGGDVNDTPGSPPLVALEANDVLDPVYDDLPAHERWTYEYNASQSMIDHLFVAKHSRGLLVAGSTRVLREDGGGLAGSDHAALIATIAPAEDK